MFTRCSACHTVHPLNASLLAQGSGLYRCGKCNKINHALESLFDEWPDAGQSAADAGGLPTLGISIEMAESESGDISTQEEFGELEQTGHQKNLSRSAWIAAALVLLVATVLQLINFFGESGLKNPSGQVDLMKIGLQEKPSANLLQELGQIQLIGSDLRSHPDTANALRLSATIINQASKQQDYPKLEVILLDSRGQAVASRLFEPAEYLADDAIVKQGMPAQAHLPIVLDLADPGRAAVGFELKIK